MTNDILLLLAALLPAVVLCIYIYKKDRTEKEPVGLLLALLIAGVIICYPAAVLERYVGDAIYEFFLNFATIENGAVTLATGKYYLYHLADNIIGVALIEEGLKWIAMWIITSKNKNFNSLFDGIIYAVFVSLGFAGFENILYVFNYGWGTAMMRMVTAVPGHMFDAVIMGYYYSSWHMYELARKRELELYKKGIIRLDDQISGKMYLVLSLVVPVLAHGFYDFCCSVDKDWTVFAFYGFIIFLYIYCFGRVHKMSNADGMDIYVADAIVLRKYPGLITYYATGTKSMAPEKNWKEEFYEEGDFPETVSWPSKQETIEEE